MTTTPNTSPENVARRVEALRRASGRFDILDCETALQVADLAEALAAESAALAEDVSTYQGMARDMTAENEALAARVAELEAEVQAMLREERNKALREAAIMVDDVATTLRHSGMHVENSDLPACARRIRALIQEAPHDPA